VFFFFFFLYQNDSFIHKFTFFNQSRDFTQWHVIVINKLRVSSLPFHDVDDDVLS